MAGGSGGGKDAIVLDLILSYERWPGPRGLTGRDSDATPEESRTWGLNNLNCQLRACDSGQRHILA
eukprot:762374-Rhodomonas_salina.1